MADTGSYCTWLEIRLWSSKARGISEVNVSACSGPQAGHWHIAQLETLGKEQADRAGSQLSSSLCGALKGRSVKSRQGGILGMDFLVKACFKDCPRFVLQGGLLQGLPKARSGCVHS